MATNEVYADGILSVVCSHPVTPQTGQPVRYGPMTGVALTDEAEGGNATGYTTVDFTMKVWDLSVEGTDEDGNSAVAVGDALFYADVDGATLTKDPTGYFFGFAMETVNSAATATINVLHVPQSSLEGVAGVELADMADLAQGSLIIGGASNRPTALSGKTDTQILVGNGTTMTSVAVSGDATLANTGALTIAALAVETGMLAAAAVTRAKLAGAFLKIGLADGTGVGANVTVAGMVVGDELVSVLAMTTKAAIATMADRTSEYAVGAGVLTKAAGTDETNNQLIIVWLDLT